MNKRGQAFFEFLSTYGWAILAVIISIAALAYFGVIRTDQFKPDLCITEVGVSCDGFAVYDSGHIFLETTNHLGKTMSNVALSLVDLDGKECVLEGVNVIRHGEKILFSSDPDDENCKFAKGEYVDLDVVMDYKISTLDSVLDHKLNGDLVGTVLKGPPFGCGNGRQNPGEECDDGNTVSGDGCSAICRNENQEATGAVCGNGFKESGEECDDGNIVNGDSCSSTCLLIVPGSCSECGDGLFFQAICGRNECQAFSEGCYFVDVLFGGGTCSSCAGATCESYDDDSTSCAANACNAGDCQWDGSSCYTGFCGDGVTSGSESCDGNVISCTDINGYPGTRTCNGGCTGYGACVSNLFCGDGTVTNPPEACDGGSRSCSIGGYSGTQICSALCTWNSCVATQWCGDGLCNGLETPGSCYADCGSCGDGLCNGPETAGSCYADCGSCGDGIITNPPEVCDGSNLGGESCTSIMGQPATGALSCGADCTFFDNSDCKPIDPPVCGDGAEDFGEECDDGCLQGIPNFCEPVIDDGDGCNYLCETEPFCPNGVKEGTENCDAPDFGGLTCQDYGYDGGTLTCTGCRFVGFGNCWRCGDGNINPGENCDGSNLGGLDCTDFGFTGGNLSCFPDGHANECDYDANGCTGGTGSGCKPPDCYKQT